MSISVKTTLKLRSKNYQQSSRNWWVSWWASALQ